MDISVALAVLAASVLHASWHALVKSSGDRLVALAGMNLVSGAAALAVLPFVSPPAPFVLLIIAGSVVLHGAYKAGLAWLYVRTDLGQAYPLARGSVPIMATLMGLAALGEFPKPAVLLGIGLVSLGLMALILDDAERRLSWRTLGAAWATGFAVAAYSVVDAYGIRLNIDWLGFTAWLIACDSAAFIAYVFVARGRRDVLAAWSGGRSSIAASGALGVVSFGVFLWALARAPVGPVSALRETSVLFASLIGGIVLREASTCIRYLAAAAVMAGIMTIALFR